MSEDLPGKHWYEEDELHIDVRGLPPPEPMVAILRQLDRAGQNGPVTVHHDREPIYLYPELAERQWAHSIIPGDEGEVRFKLTLLNS
jgi:TusA-related sulfurtransferase